MAKIGDKIACEVVAVQPDYVEETGFYPGSVTIKLLEGRGEGDTHIMVNGSVQNVPLEERVIGRVGSVRWERYGSYNGFRWSK